MIPHHQAPRPSLVRSFFAMLRDTWREFLDAKILYLLLALIGLLFGIALTGRMQIPAPRPPAKKAATTP